MSLFSVEQRAQERGEPIGAMWPGRVLVGPSYSKDVRGLPAAVMTGRDILGKPVMQTVVGRTTHPQHAGEVAVFVRGRARVERAWPVAGEEAWRLSQ